MSLVRKISLATLVIALGAGVAACNKNNGTSDNMSGTSPGAESAPTTPAPADQGAAPPATPGATEGGATTSPGTSGGDTGTGTGTGTGGSSTGGTGGATGTGTGGTGGTQ